MKAIKLGVPLFLILFSLTFTVAAFNLPKANLGNPNGPLYFPIGLGIMMLLFSLIYFIQEFKNLNKENQAINQMLSGRTPKLIGITVILGIVYALIFDSLGFLLSTIIFLGALLFLINGRKQWLINIIVAVSFSFISWYAFSEMLGVSLP